jgi:hypothetical protein
MGKGTSAGSSSPVKSPALIVPGKRRPHNARTKPERASPRSHQKKLKTGRYGPQATEQPQRHSTPDYGPREQHVPAHEQTWSSKAGPRRGPTAAPSKGHVDGTPQRPTLKRPSAIRFLDLCLSHRLDRIDSCYPQAAHRAPCLSRRGKIGHELTPRRTE